MKKKNSKRSMPDDRTFEKAPLASRVRRQGSADRKVDALDNARSRSGKVLASGENSSKKLLTAQSKMDVVPEFVDQFMMAAFRAGQINAAAFWMDIKRDCIKANQRSTRGKAAVKRKSRGR